MADEEQREGQQPKVWWKRPEWMALIVTLGVTGLFTLGYLILTKILNRA